MNDSDPPDAGPYRSPGLPAPDRAGGELAPPVELGHTPYPYDEAKTVVRFFAMCGANRSNARPVECHPTAIPEDVIRTNGQSWTYYQAENRRAYGERVTQADTVVGAIRALVSIPPLCPYTCPACQQEQREALDAHEEDFGPYLGSLGGLDTELIERRQPVVDSLDPRPFGKIR